METIFFKIIPIIPIIPIFSIKKRKSCFLHIFTRAKIIFSFLQKYKKQLRFLTCKHFSFCIHHLKSDHLSVLREFFPQKSNLYDFVLFCNPQKKIYANYRENTQFFSCLLHSFQCYFIYFFLLNAIHYSMFLFPSCWHGLFYLYCQQFHNFFTSPLLLFWRTFTWIFFCFSYLEEVLPMYRNYAISSLT